MPRFGISCTWQMYGYYEFEAQTKDEAIALAQAAPLPDGGYLTDSFEIDDCQELSSLKTGEED